MLNRNRFLFVSVALVCASLGLAPAWGRSYWGNPVPIPKVEPKDKICFAPYTVHGGVMKMVVQLFPLANDDSRQVHLEVKDKDTWKRIATETVREDPYGLRDAKAWNLRFRIENWDVTRNWSYRVVALDGVAMYEGTIRRDPVDKEEIAVAAFTGNSRWDKGSRDDIVTAVNAQDPDLLFFSGDQVYHHTDHLAEWLIFGQQFGELFRHRPAVCIPDDHDVGQGNLWGSSGKLSKARGGPDGGYIRSPQYVREVEFAQTGNLPDPHDPTPVGRGIGVYYTSLNVGGIDFAIIEDRKFKQGPLEVLPQLKGRPDHPVTSDPATLDREDAVLLGQRQLKFLEKWGEDWRGVKMKCVLSATIFCQGHTMRKIDLDTNGWPQSGRNRALAAIRKSFSFMLAGDQHLATVIHHGIDDFGDAGYSFCVPSIVNHYPRSWKPKQKPQRRIEGALNYTGDYFDGLGNRVTMYCHADPGAFKPPIKTMSKRVKQATGHGLVRFNKRTRSITIECWPRGTDVTKPDARQYPGWPVTIAQWDNYGRKPNGHLPTVVVTGMVDPVVQVTDDATGEIVYAVRIAGTTFRPPVFTDGRYTLSIGEPGTKRWQRHGGLSAVAEGDTTTIQVRF